MNAVKKYEDALQLIPHETQLLLGDIYVYVCLYVCTCYFLIKPPIPYIASSPLCVLRVFTSCLNFCS